MRQVMIVPAFPRNISNIDILLWNRCSGIKNLLTHIHRVTQLLQHLPISLEDYLGFLLKHEHIASTFDKTLLQQPPLKLKLTYHGGLI